MASKAKQPRALEKKLSDALGDLGAAVNETLDEGFPKPSQTALNNAERLLTAMYKISPRRFEVYPTPDGEIAIDAPNGQGSSVILLCKSEGGALCLANLKIGHRRSRYSNAEILPDGFLREALADLERDSD